MTDTKTEQATFAAGCFWGVEGDFRQILGVITTTVGYTGGRTEHPSYEEVCSHTTGHAEAVLVEFDPAQVSYDELLEAFWQLHDPTQLNRQGPDVGDQYRSAIFFHSPEQEAKAKASKEAAQARFSGRSSPRSPPAPMFWPAEEYHQQYLQKRGLASCAITVAN